MPREQNVKRSYRRRTEHDENKGTKKACVAAEARDKETRIS